MKIQRLEAHDRYLHLLKDQSEKVQIGADDCLKRNPDSLWYQEKCHYIYIFGHARTHDDGVTKRLIWQPRLSKPTPEPNSYLFRAESKTDVMEVCWILPPQEYWSQYKNGNVVAGNDVEWSIQQYRSNLKGMKEPFPDDLSEERAKNLLYQLALEKEQQARMDKMYAKPEILEVSPSSLGISLSYP